MEAELEPQRELSDSEGSTVVFTPKSFVDETDEATQRDVFAWLRPHSETACAAFDAAVNATIKNRGKYAHSRQFLFVRPKEKRAESVFSEDGKAADPHLAQWTGAFKLSLNIPPRDPASGWYLGTSRGHHTQEIDLLLAPPIARWVGTRIAGKHARLFFHHESCRMILEARHSVTLTRNGATVITGSSYRVIKHGELIEIGHCSYIFEYTDIHSTSAFGHNLFRYIEEHNASKCSSNKLLSPSSVGAPISVGNYYCSPSAFAQGTFGKVSAGWSYDGKPVAIKIFKKPDRTEISAHQNIMNYIGYHVRK